MIPDPFAILEAPPTGAGNAWFARIAELLLNQTHLVVAGQAHRLVEVEAYSFGGDHCDPFAHRNPVQLTCGRWCFHADRGTYRGGTYKGLDISFGPGDAYGGILIRTLRTSDGRLINGSCLCVDHLLDLTGSPDVADLDRRLDTAPVWEQSGPMYIARLEEPGMDQVLATARVGLTLKRMQAGGPGLFGHERDPRCDYIMRPYRFLTDPTIKKGKPHTLIALHQQGFSPQQIRTATGSPRKAIQTALAAYTRGLEQDDFDQFAGRPLTTSDLYQLHGVWTRVASGS